VRLLKSELENKFPSIAVHLMDERYSSKMASQSIALMGNKKKKQDKGLIDQVAAALILQDFLSQS
jgi:putative Holliday junction resolvase